VTASLAGGIGLIDPGDVNLPYPLFVLLGTVLWQVFQDSVDVPYRAFEGARSYITRVNFPREAIVLVQLFELLITSLFRFVFTVLAMLIVIDVTVNAVASLFLCFITMILFGSALGTLIAPFMILIEDVNRIVRMFFSYGIFLAPVFISPNENNIYSSVLKYNPLTPIMECAREAAAGVEVISLYPTTVIFIISVVGFVFGVLFLKKSAPLFIERMLLGGR